MTASLRECRMITRARPAAVARCFSCCLVSLLESSRRGAGDVTVTGVEGACAATGWEEPCRPRREARTAWQDMRTRPRMRNHRHG